MSTVEWTVWTDYGRSLWSRRIATGLAFVRSGRTGICHNFRYFNFVIVLQNLLVESSLWATLHSKIMSLLCWPMLYCITNIKGIVLQWIVVYWKFNLIFYVIKSSNFNISRCPQSFLFRPHSTIWHWRRVFVIMWAGCGIRPSTLYTASYYPSAVTPAERWCVVRESPPFSTLRASTITP